MQGIQEAHTRFKKLSTFLSSQNISQSFTKLNGLGHNFGDPEQKDAFKAVTALKDSTSYSGQLIGIQNDTYVVISDPSLINTSAAAWKDINGQSIVNMAKAALLKSKKGYAEFSYSIKEDDTIRPYVAVVYGSKALTPNKKLSNDFMFIIPVWNN
jgi:hypothetical protein